jgi:NitT/TauT family transport system permease protein
MSPGRRSSTGEQPGRVATAGLRIGGYVGAVVLWQLLSEYVVGEVTLPPPGSVFAEMIEIARSGELWPNAAYTFTTFLIVFAISFPVGAVLGVLMGRSRYADALLRDAIVAGLTTPGLVFVFIGVMLFGLSAWGRILAIVVIVIPIVAVNVTEGVRAVPKDLLDMATAFGVTRRETIRHALIPGIAPFLFTATRYGVAVGLRGAALVEVFGAQLGMGFQLRRAFESFSIRGTLAWTFYIILGVLLIERVVLVRLEKRFFRWRPAVRL